MACGKYEEDLQWLADQAVAGSFACCFMAVVVAGIAVSTGVVKSKQKDHASAPNATEKKPISENAEVKTLRMIPSTYAQRINPLLEKFEKPYRVDPARITNGEVQNVLERTWDRIRPWL